jgi:WD repeat, SAM and U-box domain-containing protein 1
MENPVIAADGHSYEKEAIISWLKTGSMISPMTGAKLRDRSISENFTLRRVIQ